MRSLHRGTNAHVLRWALIFLVISPLCFVLGQQGQEWGKPENGLQLSLLRSTGSAAPLTDSQFRLEIRNLGSNDLLIGLGLMLANGQRQYPNALSVLITNPNGETTECGYPGPRDLRGLVDPLIVPLPARASFVLPVDLEKWTQNWKSCFTPSAHTALNMPAGQYALRVQYVAEIEKGHRFGPWGGQILRPIPGAPTSTVAIEGEGQILFPVWVGKATSNQLKFELPRRPGGK